MKKRTIIMMPVGADCNLRCDYCYHNNIREQESVLMTDEILEKGVKDSLKLADKIVYIWHGGEPMLAGLDFYEEAIRYQKKHANGRHIENHIQTNATLIDDDWAKFFSKNSIRVSTSLDGPIWLHDLHRKYVSGKGSFEKTVKGVEKMKDFGQSVGIIITLNCENVKYPIQIYEELIKREKINGFEINNCTELGFAPSNEDLLNFYKTLFMLWSKDGNPSIHIRIFENVIRNLLGKKANDCHFRYKGCRQFLSIDDIGNIYTCSRFVKRDVAYLGNILEKNLVDIMGQKHTEDIYERCSSIAKECLDCEWLEACGGGCSYQRWQAGGFDVKHPLCEVRKKLFSFIANEVKPFL